MDQRRPNTSLESFSKVENRVRKTARPWSRSNQSRGLLSDVKSRIDTDLRSLVNDWG